MISVVLVEDEQSIRDTISEFLRVSPGIRFLGAFETAEEAVREIPTLMPDVVIMDIFLPGMTGIEAIGILKPKFPDMQFMMCTVMEDNENIFKALKSGATGYMLKRTSPAAMVAAIEELHRGGSPMSLEIARKVLASFHRNTLTDHGLSQREKEVLDLLSKGFRYKNIAETLFISVETVNTHIRHIYEKLQVNSKVDAIRKYRGD